jgi:hypothetical protein
MRVSVLLLTWGCAGNTVCSGIDDPAGLWDRAVAVRVEVYGSDARCDGGRVVAGSAPQLSRLFNAHQAIGLEVPVGVHALTFTLYADAMRYLGSACVAQDFRGDTCLHLSLMAALAGDCRSDADCLTDGGTAAICCGDRCVEAGGDAQNCGGCGVVCGGAHTVATCENGVCSGECLAGWAHCSGEVTGCETNLTAAGLKLCNGACVPATACCSDGDCVFPPAPADCFAAACVDGECQYPMRAGAQVCGATCCLPVQALCGNDCTLQCATGWSDCDAAPENGCECAGPGCCSGGCMTRHDDGVGQAFFDCAPAGTFDQTEATAACAAFTGDATQCHALACGGNNQAVCSDGSTQACDCWIYSGNNRGKVKRNAAGSCGCTGGNTSSWS